MNYCFGITTESYSREWFPKSTPQSLLSNLWFDVSYEPEILHADGTITNEAIRLTCNPFPFIYVRIVDLEKLRKGLNMIFQAIPASPLPFPSDMLKAKIQQDPKYIAAVEALQAAKKGKRKSDQPKILYAFDRFQCRPTSDTDKCCMYKLPVLCVW